MLLSLGILLTALSSACVLAAPLQTTHHHIQYVDPVPPLFNRPHLPDYSLQNRGVGGSTAKNSPTRISNLIDWSAVHNQQAASEIETTSNMAMLADSISFWEGTLHEMQKTL